MNAVPTPGRKTLAVIAGIGAVAVTATLLLGAGAPASWGSRPAGHGPGAARLCAGDHGAAFEPLIGFTEAFFAFTPPQREAWDALVGALRSGQASIEQACRDLDAAGTAPSAPERLSRLETLMATGLGVVRDVRPAFERFYAALTDAQKRALDDLAGRRHRH